MRVSVVCITDSHSHGSKGGQYVINNIAVCHRRKREDPTALQTVFPVAADEERGKKHTTDKRDAFIPRTAGEQQGWLL